MRRSARCPETKCVSAVRTSSGASLDSRGPAGALVPLDADRDGCGRVARGRRQADLVRQPRRREDGVTGRRRAHRSDHVQYAERARQRLLALDADDDPLGGSGRGARRAAQGREPGKAGSQRPQGSLDAHPRPPGVPRSTRRARVEMSGRGDSGARRGRPACRARHGVAHGRRPHDPFRSSTTEDKLPRDASLARPALRHDGGGLRAPGARRSHKRAHGVRTAGLRARRVVALPPGPARRRLPRRPRCHRAAPGRVSRRRSLRTGRAAEDRLLLRLPDGRHEAGRGQPHRLLRHGPDCRDDPRAGRALRGGVPHLRALLPADDDRHVLQRRRRPRAALPGRVRRRLGRVSLVPRARRGESAHRARRPLARRADDRAAAPHDVRRGRHPALAPPGRHAHRGRRRGRRREPQGGHVPEHPAVHRRRRARVRRHVQHLPAGRRSPSVAWTAAGRRSLGLRQPRRPRDGREARAGAGGVSHALALSRRHARRRLGQDPVHRAAGLLRRVVHRRPGRLPVPRRRGSAPPRRRPREPHRSHDRGVAHEARTAPARHAVRAGRFSFASSSERPRFREGRPDGGARARPRRGRGAGALARRLRCGEAASRGRAEPRLGGHPARA